MVENRLHSVETWEAMPRICGDGVIIMPFGTLLTSGYLANPNQTAVGYLRVQSLRQSIRMCDCRVDEVQLI